MPDTPTPPPTDPAPEDLDEDEYFRRYGLLAADRQGGLRELLSFPRITGKLQTFLPAFPVSREWRGLSFRREASV